MFENYNIKVDDKKFQKQLGDFKNKMPQVARRMMAKVSQGIRKTVRTEYLRGSVLDKETGNLYKKIKYKTKKDFTAYITASAYYATTHEQGATIEAKKGKYLTFKIGEEWKKVKKVVVPQRQFLKPVIQDYFRTDKAEDIMDMVLQQQLEKFFAKG